MKQKLSQLLKKQFKLTTVCIIVAIVSLFWFGYYTEPNDLPFSERGTYDYHVGDDRSSLVWLSVDWEQGEFWYTNQVDKQYITGTVEEYGTHRYWFRCNAEQHKGLIPDQLIERDRDDEIRLMIDNEIRRFVKSEDVTILISTDGIVYG